MSDDGDDDDLPTLSAESLAALQEFYTEQNLLQEQIAQAGKGEVPVEKVTLSEDWQLSQFWYDDATAERLAREALEVAGPQGRVACVCSPTAYKKLRELRPDTCIVKCLEFDERFKLYGEDFQFYDYKDPLNLPSDWRNSFDVVLADPPFLSEECLCKTSVTIKFLAKEKIILCTGAVMEEMALKLLQVKPCKFQPRHQNGLQNQFSSYTNYDSHLLNQS